MKLSQAKEYLPFVQAVAEGKTIQCTIDGTKWEDCNPNICEFGQGAHEPKNLRIKPELKLRPWRPEEAPIPLIIKYSTWPRGNYVIVTETINDHFWYTIYGETKDCHLKDLIDDSWEHSIDHGKTWLPCGVKE